MSSSSTSGRARTAAAASSSESGCPRASRLTLRASAGSRPALVRSSSASPSARFPSGTLSTSSLQPGAACQIATGGSRPAITRRVLSRRAGAKFPADPGCRAGAEPRMCRGRARRAPRAPPGAPPPLRRSSALLRRRLRGPSRKPRSVGSIDRQSIRTTVAPRVASLARERLEQRRLADAGDAVHEDDEPAALLQRPEQGGLLRGPADDLPPTAPRRAHGLSGSPRRLSGGGVYVASRLSGRHRREPARHAASVPRARRSRST